MNNDSNQNLIEDNDRVKEEKQIEKFANELMYSSYEQLCQKYGIEDLFEEILKELPVTNSNVSAYISMLKHLFILDFVPGENIFNITKIKKDAVIELIARADPGNTAGEIDQKLKVIDPTFAIPEGFSVEKYQVGARELFNADANIKNTIADNLLSEYLADTEHFVRLPVEKLEKLTDEINNLSTQMSSEYDKLLKNQPINNQIFEKIFHFLSEAGRTTFFIQKMGEEKNLGDLTDIIVKINISLQIANIIKEKKIDSNVSTDQIKTEIKEFLLKDLRI